MNDKNSNPTGTVRLRTSLDVHAKLGTASSLPRMRGRLGASATKIFLGLLLFPTLAIAYPFNLTWTDVNEAEDGTVLYREVSDKWVEVGIVGPNVTSFTDDPPGAEGDRFCWIARAFGGGEISESSSEACASVPITTVEPEPTKPGKGRGQQK